VTIQTIDPFPGHYDASDPFGSMKDRSYGHTGSDWGDGLGGRWIPAMAAGVVVATGYSGGNGNYVSVRMENGLYWAALHMAEPAAVNVGDSIALGQGVGVVGATGSNARGPHLHITLSDSPQAYLGLGNKQDPWEFIQAHLGHTTTAGDGLSPIQQVIKKMEAAMPVAIYEADKPGGSPWILIHPGGEYAVTGAEGEELDGVRGQDRNVAGVISRVWGPPIGLNGTDVRTVLTLNRRMTDQLHAALRR
jgi:hypothetical protein